MHKYSAYLFVFINVVMLVSCSNTPSSNEFRSNKTVNIVLVDVKDICHMFAHRPTWYPSVLNASIKYEVPINLIMAFIHQESRFVAEARPAKKEVMGIALKRPSSAYGYAQALDGTWDEYVKKSNLDAVRMKRNNFSHAVDFIGWYNQQTHARTGVAKNDVFQLYLAYHEGAGGFLRKTYLQKPWLINVAKKVEKQAEKYMWQLFSCPQNI
jgi:hypothetical protein